MGYLGNYGGTFGESALTPASNHAEAALVVKILLIREIAVLVHGRFEVRLTAASGPLPCCGARLGHFGCGLDHSPGEPLAAS